MTTSELIVRISSDDERVRTEAWQAAGPAGADAIEPLADLMTGAELEVSRAARRAMRRIVHHAGRPGAEVERPPVTRRLLSLLSGDRPETLRRDVMWMLSVIADDEAVAPLAALLRDPALREDARLVLQRLPGEAATAALRAALADAPEDFHAPLAQALRDRGEVVPGPPSARLRPTRQTGVEAAGR